MDFPEEIKYLDPHQIRLLGCQTCRDLYNERHPFVVTAVEWLASLDNNFVWEDYVNEQSIAGHVTDDLIAMCTLYALKVSIICHVLVP